MLASAVLTTPKHRLAEGADACIRMARQLVRGAEIEVRAAQAKLARYTRALELLVESEMSKEVRRSRKRKPLGFVERERLET